MRKRNIRRVAAFVATVACAVTLSTSTAGARSTTTTEHQHKFVETFHEPGFACIPASTITTTTNGVIHTTEQENGYFHITGTFTGKFSAVPDDASLPTYKGNFTQWFGFNGVAGHVETFTFHISGRGSDGSRLRFHEVAHARVLPNGDLAIEFDRVRCERG